MRPKLKICGITDLADARYCAGAGADFLGFIQHEASPRYIDPKLAGQIIEWLYGPEPVGVFVDAPVSEVNRLADEVGFTYVQLHGSELPEVCAAIERPVIKAFHVRPDTEADDLRRLMERYREHVAYFLLDTHHPEQAGGTGETFDWSVAAALADDFPLFLAGGLTPDNVQAAIETVHPFGIDLSSGIELAPGRKDFDEVGRLFDALDALEPTNADH